MSKQNKRITAFHISKFEKDVHGTNENGTVYTSANKLKASRNFSVLLRSLFSEILTIEL